MKTKLFWLAVGVCLIGGGGVAYIVSTFPPFPGKTSKADAGKIPNIQAQAPSLKKECFPIKGMAVSDADCQTSREHYLAGLKLFQDAEEINGYKKASAEWEAALLSYPGNEDAAAGLRRIADITSPNPRNSAPAEDRLASREHYLKGKKLYGAGEVPAALTEWYAALRLDITNDDAAAALYKAKGLKPGFSSAGTKKQLPSPAKGSADGVK